MLCELVEWQLPWLQGMEINKNRNRNSTQTGICHTHAHRDTCTITIAIACAGLCVRGWLWVSLRFGFGSGLPLALPLALPLSFLFSAATRALYLVSALSGGSSSRLQNDMVITYIIYHTPYIDTRPERMYVQLVSRTHYLQLDGAATVFSDGVFHHWSDRAFALDSLRWLYRAFF